MSDAETKHVVELQTQFAAKLQELGFRDEAHVRQLVHDLAEIAARCRTFEQQSLPLFTTLSAEHHRSFAQLLLEIRNDLNAIRDSINDAQPALQALFDFLVSKSSGA